MLLESAYIPDEIVTNETKPEEDVLRIFDEYQSEIKAAMENNDDESILQSQGILYKILKFEDNCKEAINGREMTELADDLIFMKKRELDFLMVELAQKIFAFYKQEIEALESTKDDAAQKDSISDLLISEGFSKEYSKLLIDNVGEKETRDFYQKYIDYSLVQSLARLYFAFFPILNKTQYLNEWPEIKEINDYALSLAERLQIIEDKETGFSDYYWNDFNNSFSRLNGDRDICLKVMEKAASEKTHYSEEQLEGLKYWFRMKELELAQKKLDSVLAPMSNIIQVKLLNEIYALKDRTVEEISAELEISQACAEQGLSRIKAEEQFLQWLQENPEFKDYSIQNLHSYLFMADASQWTRVYRIQPNRCASTIKQSGIPVFYPGCFITDGEILPQENGKFMRPREWSNKKNPFGILGLKLVKARNGSMSNTAMLDSMIHEGVHQVDFLEPERKGINKLITEILAYQVTDSNYLFIAKHMENYFFQVFINSDEEISSDEARQKIQRSCEVIKKLCDNYGRHLVTQILLNSKTLDEVITWGDVSDEEMRELMKPAKESL